MFVKRVESVLWMTHTQFRADRRTNFVAIYVFDDGFATKEDCEKRICELNLNHDDFAMLLFAGQWYAVNIHSYISSLVITKENVFLKTEAFQLWRSMPAEEAKIEKAMVRSFATDIKHWQDGIVSDLEMSDGQDGPEVWKNGKKAGRESVPYNNVLICFGLHFFINEICIRTQDYIEHVFANYYNDTSLRYIAREIEELQEDGYEYYNPFRKTVSRNEKEKTSKQKKIIGKLTVPPVIMRPMIMPGVKRLKQREQYPPAMW